MNPIRTTLLTTLTLSLTAALAAQQPACLLFSTSAGEETKSGSNGTSLRLLDDRSIGFVTPSAAGYSAEKFGPALAFQTLAGDEDGDGDVYTPDLMRAIDAITVLPYSWSGELGVQPRTRPVNLLECYVSPSVDVGTTVSGAPGLRKGDCGVITRVGALNGQVRHFIRAEQLISALGMFDPVTQQSLASQDIDLDAITVSYNRDIFVSFDSDHSVRLRVGAGFANFTLADGAIACIPAAAWTPNAHGEVANVLPNRGVIVFSEAQVDAMVANAAIADVFGACPNAIDDTEGLAIDPNGGGFNLQWGNMVLAMPDLLISGEKLSGAGVISTRAGGAIGNVNGQALGRACGVGPTDGGQMGLRVSGSVAHLGGLETLATEPCWFALGSNTPTGLGGVITVHVGTNLPVAMVFLGYGLGALPVSPSMSFSPWAPNLLCFPEIYPAILGHAPVPMALAAGGPNTMFGTLTANTPVIAQGILFQAVTVTMNGLELSSPITIH